MTGTVATALSAAFRPSPPRGMIEVDEPLLGRELGELLAAAAGHERERAVGQARALDRLDGDRREHGVRVRRRGGAPQHDRVAGLERQRGGVDRHVRPRLVDDGDDAQRHAHLAHVEPVRQPEAVEHLADRVLEGDDLAHARGHRRHATRVEREAIHQRARQPGLAPRLEVARVGLEDLGRARLERVGHRQQRGVLRAESIVASARAARLAARQMSVTDWVARAMARDSLKRSASRAQASTK